MTAECVQCKSLFDSLKNYEDFPFDLEHLTEYAAQGCEICKILQNAVTQLADFPGHEQILQSKAKISGYRTLQLEGDLSDITGSEEAEFTLYYEQGTVPASSSIPGLFHACRHVEENSSSPECIQLIKKWFNDCKTNHQECSQEVSALPTRIIMIQDASAGPRLKLVEPVNVKASYVALSHRWATENMLKLTTVNRLALKEEIPWSALTQTFQDAVTLCDTLGIHYLWIDCLCILQDNSLDWGHESSRMLEIYRNATLVIGASVEASPGGGVGFFGPRKPHFRQFVGKMVLPGVSEPIDIYMMKAPTHIRTASIEDPLSYRGWTYQERLLARRSVFFHSSELVWECDWSEKCECGMLDSWSNPGDSQLDFSLRSLLAHSSETEIYTAWSDQVVYLYCRRELTYDSDKLPALSGAAKFFQERLQDEYLAGMWKGDLVQSLGWSIPFDELGKLLPADYRAPSWSWASVNSGIFCSERTSLEVFAELVDAKCITDERFPFGRVSGGYITLKAPVTEAWIQDAPGGIIQSDILHLQLKPNHASYVYWRFHPDAALSTKARITNPNGQTEVVVQRTNFPDHKFRPRERNKAPFSVKVWCVSIGIELTQSKHEEEVTLVLSKSPTEPEYYVRLGVIRDMVTSGGRSLKTATMRTVTIV